MPVILESGAEQCSALRPARMPEDDYVDPEYAMQEDAPGWLVGLLLAVFWILLGIGRAWERLIGMRQGRAGAPPHAVPTVNQPTERRARSARPTR